MSSEKSTWPLARDRFLENGGAKRRIGFRSYRRGSSEKIYGFEKKLRRGNLAKQVAQQRDGSMVQ